MKGNDKLEIAQKILGQNVVDFAHNTTKIK